MAGNVKVILGSLGANLGIAAAKGTAAFFTGSGSMLAESIHSLADCTNQVLLLIGVRESQKPPDDKHPLGRGKAAYFWSFLVALMIFAGGGVFSIYEGLHKLAVPEQVHDAWIGYVVLGVSILIEAAAALQVAREIDRKRGPTSFVAFLSRTKDADLIVLFAENTAACAGLVFAMIALVLADVLHDPKWDAIGSIGIGVLLCVVAVWLAREVKSLLQGESADPEIEAAFREEAGKDARIVRIKYMLTVQQGPGTVVLAAKLVMAGDITAEGMSNATNELQARMRARHPELRWQFVETELDGA